MNKFATFFLLAFLLAAPATALGAGLVPCGGDPPEPACDFTYLLALANNVVDFLIKIGGLVAVIAVVYIGWIFVTSGGNPDARSRAKSILLNVVIGIALMLGAWLIVHLIVRALGYQGTNADFVGELRTNR